MQCTRTKCKCKAQQAVSCLISIAHSPMTAILSTIHNQPASAWMLLVVACMLLLLSVEGKKRQGARQAALSGQAACALYRPTGGWVAEWLSERAASSQVSFSKYLIMSGCLTGFLAGCWHRTMLMAGGRWSRTHIVSGWLVSLTRSWWLLRTHAEC